jgi:cold shock CspA family protein
MLLGYSEIGAFNQAFNRWTEKRAGLTSLDEGQRVVVDIAEGRKGPKAVGVQLA